MLHVALFSVFVSIPLCVHVDVKVKPKLGMRRGGFKPPTKSSPPQSSHMQGHTEREQESSSTVESTVTVNSTGTKYYNVMWYVSLTCTCIYMYMVYVHATFTCITVTARFPSYSPGKVQLHRIG